MEFIRYKVLLIVVLIDIVQLAYYHRLYKMKRFFARLNFFLQFSFFRYLCKKKNTPDHRPGSRQVGYPATQLNTINHIVAEAQRLAFVASHLNIIEKLRAGNCQLPPR